MAWKHGPAHSEKALIRRREHEFATMREADWLGKRLIVIGGSMYPHRFVLHAILDRVHRERGIKEVIVNRLTNTPVPMYGEFDVPYTETIQAYQPDPLPESVRLPGIDGTPESLWPNAMRESLRLACLHPWRRSKCWPETPPTRMPAICGRL
jgi:hypothetical protein